MSKDLNIVIPFKDPIGSKERLGDVLTPEERFELALLLFDETLRFLNGFEASPHVSVITDSEDIARRAQRLHANPIMEEQGRGETEAVEAATRRSVADGFRSQLVMPADMAIWDEGDLKQLLNHPRPNPSVIYCPATGDDGTNAILSTPPDVVRFRFGDRSFPDYVARAKDNGVPCTILRLKSLTLDLDTPADLETFLKQAPGNAADKLLRSWHVLARLKQHA